MNTMSSWKNLLRIGYDDIRYCTCFTMKERVHWCKKLQSLASGAEMDWLKSVDESYNFTLVLHFIRALWAEMYNPVKLPASCWLQLCSRRSQPSRFFKKYKNSTVFFQLLSPSMLVFRKCEVPHHVQNDAAVNFSKKISKNKEKKQRRDDFEAELVVEHQAQWKLARIGGNFLRLN